MNYKIPVYEPNLAGNEKLYVNQCLDAGWISGKGDFVKKFETQFADYTDIQFATSVCNGTVALHLALLAIGVGPGDEVIVPTFTYIAPANAILYCGAKPIFVDSVRKTWQIDPEDVRRAITPKTKAILAVHLYGHSAQMDELVQIAKQHRLFLVEDCAEAFGTYFNGKHVGGFGDVATFSFYGNKTITTGEGGMVTSNDEVIYQRVTHLKAQGIAKHREYWHDIVGFNYRMTNICAAIGLAQLENADKTIQRKREIAKIYEKMFMNSEFEMHSEDKDTIHSYWMCSGLTRDSNLRDKVRMYLKEQGIETRPTFFPVHTMPMYSQYYKRFPIAENLALRGLNLPSYPGLSDSQVEMIAKHVLTSLAPTQQHRNAFESTLTLH